MEDNKKPVSYYIRTYAKYVIPAWVFPVYVVLIGFTLLQSTKYPMLWFFGVVGIPFWITGFWSSTPWRKGEMPYGISVLLTMVVPFLIFPVAGIIIGLLIGYFE